ncbi:T9SS type A sorting domain-containing protein [Tenacibaculum sp. 190524A02b]|uniref:Por secretion system C-terminal sorting domain-containing protein n=1 Tax=Tenacibaculum vairaonense TaxID=3137860 RepID=A0ABM9PLH4_9FLAO
MRLKNKLKISIVFLLLSIGALQAQEVVTSSGGNATGEGSSSYSIGGVVYSTHSSAEGSVTEGVQQPYEISTTLGVEIEDIQLNLKAYPNPTINNLTLSIGNYTEKNVSYKLYTIQGRLLEAEKLKDVKTTINMESLPESAYMLSVYSNQNLIKTFKIIKN